MSGTYADLHKTTAELDAERRAELSKGHRPNAAAMKLEQAAQFPTMQPEHPTPQQLAETREQVLTIVAEQIPPRGAMKAEQIAQANIAIGRWTPEEAKEFERQTKAAGPQEALRLVARETNELREHVRDERIKTMQPEQIQAVYRAVGQEQLAAELPDRLAKGAAIGEGEKARLDAARDALKKQADFNAKTPQQQREQVTELRHPTKSLPEIERQQQNEWMKAAEQPRSPTAKPGQVDLGPLHAARMEELRRSMNAAPTGPELDRTGPKR